MAFLAGVGDLQRICKDAFRVAGAVQETCSSDFLRGAAFWSIRSVGLLRCFCVAGAALRMTWHQFFVAGKYFRDRPEKSHRQKQDDGWTAAWTDRELSRWMERERDG